MNLDLQRKQKVRIYTDKEGLISKSGIV